MTIHITIIYDATTLLFPNHLLSLVQENMEITKLLIFLMDKHCERFSETIGQTKWNGGTWIELHDYLLPSKSHCKMIIHINIK